MDPYLSWVTKGVYAYMAAHTYDGCKVSMPSNGSVAQTLGISRPMVSDSIRYLIARGHVKRLGTGADGTYLYKLTSRIFEKKRKEGRAGFLPATAARAVTTGSFLDLPRVAGSTAARVVAAAR